MIRLRERKAITLIELLIALIIGGIVVLSAFATFAYFFGEVDKGEEKSALQRDADIAAYWAELVIREGSWAYLDQNGDDSLAVQNLIDGWIKRIYADGGSLMAEVDGDTEAVIDTLDFIHFYPRIGRVEYELQVQNEGGTVELRSSKSLRNVQYNGLWHFGEGSGDITYDDSPYNNNAAIYGASWTSGEVGGALAFDGSGSYLLIPDNDDLDSGQRVGFSAWVQGSGFSSGRTIINRGAQTPGQGFFWVYVQGNRIRYSFTTGAVVTLASDSLSWQSGQWYELYVQHDAVSRRVHFYRDGLKVGSGTYAGAATPVTSGDAYIGAYQGSSSFWNGKLDEVKFESF